MRLWTMTTMGDAVFFRFYSKGFSLVWTDKILEFMNGLIFYSIWLKRICVCVCVRFFFSISIRSVLDSVGHRRRSQHQQRQSTSVDGYRFIWSKLSSAVYLLTLLRLVDSSVVAHNPTQSPRNVRYMNVCKRILWELETFNDYIRSRAFSWRDLLPF